jgi:hypothetical protein
METAVGIEPTRTDVADRCLPTWRHGHGVVEVVRSCDWYVRQDSNPHSPGSKPGALSSWATDARVFMWIDWFQDEESHLGFEIQRLAFCCYTILDEESGPDGRIRTFDPLAPNEMR